MKKVFIGVGHGGKDPGAVAFGYKEAEFNLDIALACRDALRSSGVDARVSRESNITEDLVYRIKECNEFNPDLALDIHNNAGKGDGAEVYYTKFGGTGKKLANNILAEMKKIGQNSRGAKIRKNSSGNDYFGFIRQTKCPAVLVECAFIDNATDVKIIDTLAERKAMGIAIALGILKTLNVAYKAPVTQVQKKPAASANKTSFFPERGYFKQGDVSANIGKISAFMRKVFPSYTNAKAAGNTYNSYLVKAVKEFQRRTKLNKDGLIGPDTVAELQKYGFKI
jgi:N-acetylmuramoyl-L-alanine amidase